MIVDSDNGFGGYGSEIVRYLKDDFGSKSVAVYPVFPATVLGKLIQWKIYILNRVT